MAAGANILLRDIWNSLSKKFFLAFAAIKNFLKFMVFLRRFYLGCFLPAAKLYLSDPCPFFTTPYIAYYDSLNEAIAFFNNENL